MTPQTKYQVAAWLHERMHSAKGAAVIGLVGEQCCKLARYEQLRGADDLGFGRFVFRAWVYLIVTHDIAAHNGMVPRSDRADHEDEDLPF